MTRHYTGPERREKSEDREGRRIGDQRCPDHHLLWKHHDEDKDHFRASVEKNQGAACGKIKEVRENLVIEVDKLEKADATILTEIKDIRNSIVGKYWFRVVIGFLSIGVVALGVQQNWAFREILENQRDFTRSINSIENNQIDLSSKVTVFEKEIEAINKRQDVLRDAHLKIVQGK